MRMKKYLSGILALALAFNTGTVRPLAAGNEQAGRAVNQVASAEETVYVNSYGTGKRSVSFNEHWRFYLGDLNGAEAVAYNDAAWTDVNLPHDYSIDQGYSTAAPAEQESGYVLGGTGWYRKSFTLDGDVQGKRVSVEFDGVYMNATVYLNGQKLGIHHYGYTPFSFVLPEDRLNFGGRENVLAVKVEHKQPSSRWYSGSGIYRDVNLTITNPVHVAYYGTTVTTPDIENGTGTVSVKTAVQNDSRQAVNISVLQKVYELDGPEPIVTGQKTAAQSVAAGQTADITDTVTVPSPKLWSDKTPNMYTVRTEIYVGEDMVDSYDSDFGFRWTKFTRDNGFFLNGQNVKLHGVSMHHDQGGLGSEAWRRSVERQVEILQKMGVNAIRVTHNPASQVLIDICNRKGVMLVEESFDCWLSGKAGNTEDYGKWFSQPIEEENHIVAGEDCEQWAEFDLKMMVKRGRNAPSIIMWSLGNEIFQQLIDSSMNSQFPDMAKKLITWVGEEDATRYVTFGDNWFKGNESNGSHVATQVARVFAEAEKYGIPGGLPGYNYGNSGQINNGHNQGWMVYGSETASAVNSRGVYDRKNSNSDGNVGDRRLTSYDKSAVGWGHTASDGLWITMRQAFNAGEFVWTGFDYIGEPTPYNWQGTGSNGTWPNVSKSSYFGIIDTAGFPKDSYYLYQSQWNDELHTLHVLPVWNEDEIMKDSSGKVEVVVYSDAPVIKLYLNGEEVGTAKAVYTDMPAGGYQNYTTGTGCFDTGKANGSSSSSLYATFQVPYEEGKLEAKAFEANGITEIKDTDGRSYVETTKNANRLAVSADRGKIVADGKDLSYITIDVTDSDGKFVNGAEPEITVSVEGAGKLLALDNGVQNDVTAHGEPVRKAGKGKLLAIVQSTEEAGNFTVTASAPGYAGGTVTVETEADGGSGTTEKSVVSYRLSRNYYVKRGASPSLANTVQINYTDGTSENKQVTWDAVPSGQDSYSVYGTVKDLGLRVSVNVMVIGDVAKVLNYSAAIGKGAEISLPSTRPAVAPDGTVMTAEFPVEWSIPAALTASAGTKQVKGKADVFGEEMEVTASVRVTTGGYRDGDEALPNVPEMYINGVSSKDSSTVANVLEKLKDGRVSKEDVAWSGRGTLDFRLDTAIDLKDFTLYLKDTAPLSGTMKVYSSGDNGASWNLSDCKVTNRKADGVTIRTLAPENTASETWYRVEFEKTATLVELEMNTRIPTFPVGTEAALASLNVGGHIANSATIEKGWYGLEDTSLDAADITAVGKDNASVTVLPKDRENILRILLESENHGTRSIYQVRLGQLNISSNANDASSDYAYGNMKLTAPSYHGDEPPEKANDGNTGTIWHSRWGNTGSGEMNLTNLPEQRYLQMELQETAMVNGLRYLPRSSDKNGIVLQYEIKVSMDGQSWTSVSTGNWNTAVEWKLAEFASVQAKYIRLYGVATSDNSGNAANQFMSAAEVRVRCAAKELYSGNTTVAVAEEMLDYTGEAVTPKPTVTYKASAEAEGVVLTEGTDYALSYRDNVEPGTAAVIVTGINSYSGIVEADFTIRAIDVEVTEYETVNVTTGKGEYPGLPGTVTAVTNIGQQLMEVRWDTINSSLVDKFGTFTVYGTVAGTDARIPARVTVSDIIGVRQVTLAAARGTEPDMPNQVTVYYSNGDTAERDVIWDMAEADFDTAGSVRVTGSVGKAQAVAVIRVEEVTADVNNTPIYTNLALNENGASAPKEWPRTFAYISPSGDPAHNATDGVKDFVSSASKKIWSDWESGKYHTNTGAAVGADDRLPFVATAFGKDGSADSADQKKYTVNKVSIGFMEEDGDSEHKVRLPQAYKIEYYKANSGVIPANRLENDSAGGCSNTKGWGADNPIKAFDGWEEVKYISKPDVPRLDGFKQMVDVTFQAVETTAVRITLTPLNQNWTGLEEFEVYYDPVVKNDAYEVTEICVDGTDVLGRFDKNTKTLELSAESGVITAEATNNASVTVLDAVGGIAKVIFVPENGDESKKQEYTVKFQQVQESQKYLVSAEDDLVEMEQGEAAQGFRVAFWAKAGYTFAEAPIIVKSADGIAADISVTEKDGSYAFTMPGYPVTIRGAAVPEVYTIAYELNGGTAENRTEYTVETRDFTLRNPVKEGAVFVGWSSETVTEPQLQMIVKEGTTGNLKFTANWREGTSCTVTFDSDGGTPVETQEVDVRAGKVTEPEAPKKRGYTFEGWYADAERSRQWDFAQDKVLGDMVLYAKWAEAAVIVNTKMPARLFGKAFRMPETINVTSVGERFDTDVVWNKEDVAAVMAAAEVGRYTVRGTLTGLGDRAVRTEIIASPADIIYFVDSGADTFTEKGALLAEANAATMRNETPDGAYSPETGWGFTNDVSELEINGNGDAYTTIRNFKSEVNGKTLTYQFALEAGVYDIAAGFYDPWAQWAKDNRHAKVFVADAAGKELAAKADHNIKDKEQVDFQKITLEKAGSITLNVAPVNSGENSDVMISYIVISQQPEYAEEKAGLKAALDIASSLKRADYTEESYQRLLAAISEAQGMYESGKATGEELMAQVDKLADAVKNLKPAVKDDYSAIQEEISKKQEELNAAAAQAKKLEEELNRLKAEAEKMEAALAKSQAETDKIREELKKLQMGESTLKKGDTDSAGGLRYRVTDAAKKQAEVYGVENKKLKTVKVADTVKIHGVSCTVTGIAAKAFSGLRNVKKAEIGKNVVSIGKRAFYGDKKLARITVKGTELKNVGSQALKGISAKAVIKVPKTKKKDYTRLFKKKGQKKSVKIK
ncbi:Ig-like domain-containing protein [Lachnospiraceae bacterium 46-15]